MGQSSDRERRLEDDALLRRSLVAESNAALCKGALCALLLAVAGTGFIGMLMHTGVAQGLTVPWFFCALCMVSCGALYLLALHEWVYGWRAWLILVPFASLPTLFFLLAHEFLPSGAATFITGPISYLYFVTLAVAGFAFDFRLSAVASLVAAGGYQHFLLLSRAGLHTLSAPDPLLVQELTSPAIHGFKSLTILAGGLIVAALAVVARRLMVRVLEEEREKNLLSRLFGQYVSEAVKTRLLRTPNAEAGERKEVVILFADLRGFTEYSEAVRPEELVDQLNAYFDVMVKAISLRGGVIDKFIGDAVMATFGGLVHLDDPCTLALEAAREMRVRLDLLNATWRSQGRELLDNGIGLHVGEVVLGAIGSELRKDFTVIGDAVNTASRVESLTKQYGDPILLTGAVYERLPRSLKSLCRSLGPAQVKGRRAPLELYGVPEGPSVASTRVAR